MRTLAILQARVSSSRLPGKVLKEICGKPMLWLQTERILRAKNIDKLVIATSFDITDDPIEHLCKDKGIECYRGSLDNVLERYYRCAMPYNPEYVLRLTGDCPLIDHTILDELITYATSSEFDYASNCHEPTYPDGMDAEILKFDILKDIHKQAKLESELEHVTLYIHNNSERYKLGCLKSKVNYSKLRWTVDMPEDFEFVKKIYEYFYFDDPDFSFSSIINFLKSHPDIEKLNSRFRRNEGLEKSLQKDAIIMSRKGYTNGTKKHFS